MIRGSSEHAHTRTKRHSISGIDQTVSRQGCARRVVVIVVVVAAGRHGSVAVVVRISSFPLSG